MTALTLLTAGALAGGATPTSAPTPVDRCARVLPGEESGPPRRRPLEPEDLVSLRDIGPVDPESFNARLFTLSPDGRRVAFQLRRADPQRNAYCLAMVVMERRPGARPVIVDQGGDLIRVNFDFRGKAAFPTGIAAAVTPRWSPNGEWITFLKRVGKRTQLWRAQADGSFSMPLTRSEDDVEDFRIAPGGSAIIFSSRPGLRLAREAIAHEEISGFHYDERFSPVSSERPFPPAPIPRASFVLDLASGDVRPASEAEDRLLQDQDMADGVWTSAFAHDRRRVRIIAAPSLGGGAAASLQAEVANGAIIVSCEHPACERVTRPWWTPDGKRVRFFRREGWGRASTAIYEWIPGATPPRRLYVTEDVLADCVPTGDAVLCLRESSLQPRRLELLNLATGERQILFDPNPELRALRLGRAERLQWRNHLGLETYGDLVLPVGYRAGQSYPLIVVQYQSRGFLRGGTGDEYPIQAFANRGYAVLSVNAPAPISSRHAVTDATEAGRIDLAGFAERRSTLSSVEAGVRRLIAQGIADPARIGITGLSDGASTVQFALLHSRIFAAAAMSSCCFDTTLPTRVGPGSAPHFHAQGYPRMTDDGEAFWRQLSLSRNARQVRTPILLQLSDDELMSALESYTALREVGAPIDMFVFPEEHHVKWQPAHRLALYRRSLDWFDYWLRGLRSSSPARQTELSHWESLRRKAASLPAASRGSQ